MTKESDVRRNEPPLDYLSPPTKKRWEPYDVFKAIALTVAAVAILAAVILALRPWINFVLWDWGSF